MTVYIIDENRTRLELDDFDRVFLLEGATITDINYGLTGAVADADGVVDGINIGIQGDIVTRSHAILLDFNASAVTNSSVFIGATGSVVSFEGTGIDFDDGSNNEFTNAGEVLASGKALIMGGSATEIVNTGTMTSLSTIGTIELTSGDVSMSNSGTIVGEGSSSSVGVVQANATGSFHLANDGNISARDFLGLAVSGSSSGNDTIRNSGTFGGSVAMNDGFNNLTNSGDVLGSVFGGSGSDEVTNSGAITGDVHLRGSWDWLSNTGSINGSVFMGTGYDEVINDGKILGVVHDATYVLNGGGGAILGRIETSQGLTLENAGTLSDVRVSGGTSEIANAGSIGAITLASGADLYVTSGNGSAISVSGGLGDDTLSGGAAADEFDGGDDADLLRGKGGDDALTGGKGEDKIHGGSGDDTISGGSESDDLRGGSGSDAISGGKGNDGLRGHKGDDGLRGNDGSDILRGGSGDDTLDGGRGTDEMTGGSGADTFVYSALNESGTGDKADLITDFKVGIDVVDLVALGLNARLVNGYSGGGKAEFRLTEGGGNTRLRLDADGDGSRDFEILLIGVEGATAADFLF